MQITEEIQDDKAQAVTAFEDEVCVYLIESGRLKKSDLKRAETFRDQNGGDLITLLVRLGLVSERDVAEAESQSNQQACGQPPYPTGCALQREYRGGMCSHWL